MELRFEEEAIALVVAQIENNNVPEGYDAYLVRIVWFTKTLKNWKAMVADLNPGGNFYEVTYNGTDKEAYIDEYLKVSNTIVKDSE